LLLERSNVELTHSVGLRTPGAKRNQSQLAPNGFNSGLGREGFAQPASRATLALF